VLDPARFGTPDRSPITVTHISYWMMLRGILRSLLAIPWLAVWFVPFALALRSEPEEALLLISGAIAAFLYIHVVRPSVRTRRQAARLRLRTATPYLKWIGIATISQILLLLLTVSLHEELAAWKLLPPLPANDDYPAAAFLQSPAGAATMLLAWSVFVPLVEEFAFRGWMQYELESATGLYAALLIPAAVFCALHGLVIAIHHFPYALFVGWLVWRTGSLWTAVAMHAANNGLVAILAIVSAHSSGTDDWSPTWIHAVGATVVVVIGFPIAVRRIDQIALTHRPNRPATIWPRRAKVPVPTALST
jgi:membrane protease YdiL (CAAX protease family)